MPRLLWVFFMLARVIYGAVDGTLISQLLVGSHGLSQNTAIALGLGLPVPSHVISVGLVLRRRWMPDWLAKISVSAVFISGCWRRAALVVKFFAI